MAIRRGEEEREWTVAEGVGDVLRFLARRAPAALALWLVLGGLALAWANAGAIGAGGLSAFGFLMALVGALAGAASGAALSKGLPDAVPFAGWIPPTLAGAAALAVVAFGWLCVSRALGVADDHLGALVAGAGALGALGAVLRFAWAAA
jgi:hypothetical protein